MSGNITRRGKHSWRIKYDAGRDPVTGKRKTVFRTVRGTKKEAETALTLALASVHGEAHVDPTRLTVAAHLTAWLEAQKTQVSGKTVERFGDIVNKHLIPALGHHRLQKLTPMHLQTYYSGALASGRIGGGKLAPRTVVHFHRVIYSALRHAMRMNLVVRNVAEMVSPPKVPKVEVASLDEHQIAKVLAVAAGSAFYVPILLAATTGLRRGEVLGLRWKDVDLDRARLHVTQTLEQTRERIAAKSPKTDKSRRTVILPAITVEALRKQRVEQAKARLSVGLGRDDEGLVFADAVGAPPIPHSLTKNFLRIARKAGMPPITFHGLRHSHATHLLKLGINPKIASERLGHAGVGITLDTYSHVLPALQDDAAQAVDAAFRAALKDG